MSEHIRDCGVCGETDYVKEIPVRILDAQSDEGAAILDACESCRWGLYSELKALLSSERGRAEDPDHSVLLEFDSGLPTETEVAQIRETFPDDYTITGVGQ